MSKSDESRKRGLIRLRHEQEMAEAKAEEMSSQAERFDKLADPSAAARVVYAHQLFQTPEPLAARVASMILKYGRTLEPSAGLGRLYKAIRRVEQDCEIVLVDIAPGCCRELFLATEGDELAKLIQGDFLTMGIDRLGEFDTILMNPPFTMGSDVKHVRHALTLLRPGGRLVSLVASGPKQRAALQPIATHWFDLEEGSFKSEGTGVSAAVLIIDKE